MGPNAQVQARLGRARPGLAQPPCPARVCPARLCPAPLCPARPSARQCSRVPSKIGHRCAQPGHARPGHRPAAPRSSVPSPAVLRVTFGLRSSSKPTKAGPRFWACARTRSPIPGAAKSQVHTQNRPCPAAPKGLKRDFFGRRRQSGSTRGALPNGPCESVDGLN